MMLPVSTTINVFMNMKIIKQTIAYTDEMVHHAAIHLGHHCLLMYLLRGFCQLCVNFLFKLAK